MSRLSQLNSPLLLGFEQFERTLERAAKASTEGYPPYNIETIGKEGLRITLAVAGFSPDQLEVQREGNQLTVRGKNTDDAALANANAREFLHRGIAARAFQRNFVLAEGIEIASATLDMGLLNIDLVQPTPQQMIRTIEIETPGRKSGTIRPHSVDIETE